MQPHRGGKLDAIITVGWIKQIVTSVNVPDFNTISTSGPARPVVAVYGGAFDPIHFGHLGCIEALLGGRTITSGDQTHIIDQVWVVPSEDHRSDKQCICPQTTRLYLCKLAVQELNLHTRGVAVDTITRWKPAGDLETGTIQTGTIQTGTMALLDTLSSRFPEVLFFPVIGSELIGSLPSWKQSSRLSREVTFIVVKRSGIAGAPDMGTSRPDNGFRMFDPIVCSLPPYSSSSIRALLATNHCSAKELAHYVPSTVAQYILKNQLYRES